MKEKIKKLMKKEDNKKVLIAVLSVLAILSLIGNVVLGVLFVSTSVVYSEEVRTSMQWCTLTYDVAEQFNAALTWLQAYDPQKFGENQPMLIERGRCTVLINK